MGGGGTLIYALHRPDLFSSAAPLSPAIGPTNPNKFIEWIFRNNYNYNYDFDYIEGDLQALLNNNHPRILINKIPISEINSVRWFIDTGDDDYLYEDSSLLHIDFSDKGINHEYRVRDGAHTWTYWRESLPTVLEFVSQGFHQY